MASPPPVSVVLVPDRLIDGTGEALPLGTVLRIGSVCIDAIGRRDDVAGDGAELVPLPGCTVLPGLIDMHGYLSIDPDRPNPMAQMHGEDLAARRAIAVRHLMRDLLSGVTTLRVMGEGGGLDITLRNEIADGRLTGPSIVTAGAPLAPSGSHQAPPDGGIDSEQVLIRAIEDRAVQGVNWLKLVATGGVNASGDGGRRQIYDHQLMMRAAEAAAHRNLPLAVAAHGGPAIRDAIEAGAATLEHCALLDDDEARRIAAGPTVPVLTLSRFFLPHGIEKSARSAPDILQAVERARASYRRTVRTLADAGSDFCLGTDNMHGAIADDARLAVELGFRPGAVIRALTGTAARVLRQAGEIGTLRPGSRANLIAVAGDPMTDIRALTRIRGIWRAGQRVADGEPTAISTGAAP